MVSTDLILWCGDGHLHHALRAAHQSTGDQRIERLVPVRHGAQQHGQIDACDEFGTNAIDQFLRHIAGRRTKNIHQHQRVRGAHLL